MESLSERRAVSDVYLVAVERSRAVPNFWMGDDFLALCDWEWNKVGNLEGYWDEESGGWWLPPLKDGSLFLGGEKIWAGLPVKSDEGAEGEFLDYQFMYDPRRFLNLRGGRWAIFRKNIRKWPERFGGKGWSYYEVEEGREGCVTRLVEDWAVRIGDIYDPEMVVKLVLWGTRKKGLWRAGELVGLNVWDENYAFVNYRLCVDNGEPYLQEFLRYLFYTQDASMAGRWVNDGGSLGREGLERFKFKLNPVAVWKVFSSEKEDVHVGGEVGSG